MSPIGRVQRSDGRLALIPRTLIVGHSRRRCRHVTLVDVGPNVGHNGFERCKIAQAGRTCSAWHRDNVEACECRYRDRNQNDRKQQLLHLSILCAAPVTRGLNRPGSVVKASCFVERVAGKLATILWGPSCPSVWSSTLCILLSAGRRSEPEPMSGCGEHADRPECPRLGRAGQEVSAATHHPCSCIAGAVNSALFIRFARRICRLVCSSPASSGMTTGTVRHMLCVGSTSRHCLMSSL